MAEEDDRLLAWGLATFHATLLVAILLSLGHAAGALGGLLAGLSTLAGFALFGVLWLVTLWTNARWLADVALLAPEIDGWHVIRRGAVWGAPTGVVFVLGFLAVFVLGEIGPNTRFTLDAVLGALGALVLVAGVGSAFAAVVGSLVGGLLAALDVGLVRAASTFVPDGRDAGERL